MFFLLTFHTVSLICMKFRHYMQTLQIDYYPITQKKTVSGKNELYGSDAKPSIYSFYSILNLLISVYFFADISHSLFINIGTHDDVQYDILTTLVHSLLTCN